MGNIQILKDALDWAKNNPDKHNQADIDNCIIGHWCVENSAENTRLSEADFADASGISCTEALKLFSEFNYDKPAAIAYAEELIAKYSPKYPIGTNIKHKRSGNAYVVTDAYTDFDRGVLSVASGNAYRIALSNIDANYIIVENEVTTPDFEYVVRFNGIEVDTHADKRDAVIAGQAIRSYFEAVEAYPVVYTSQVTVNERPVKPAEVEIDF